jgi:ABC-type phosphate/phosphonate transport system permease subunit
MQWCNWLRHCYKPEGHGFHSWWGHWIFHYLFLLAILWLWGTKNISWLLRQLLHRADNLATIMCRLSRNPGSSASWNPQGLPRPVCDTIIYSFTIEFFGIKMYIKLISYSSYFAEILTIFNILLVYSKREPG